MSDQGPELPEDDALAAEHALGVLNARDRAAAEARAARDPAFAAEVEAWSERLAPMLGAVEPVQPPAGVWLRIERGLPANDDQAGAAKGLRFWRGATAGSLGLAAASMAVAAMLAVQPPEIVAPPPMEPMLNARLAGPAGRPMFLAAYDPARRSVMVASLVPAGADPGHSHELWLIPADGRPRSLGLVAPGASEVMKISDDMAAMAKEGAGLAVTVEPLGGSPGDGPSGPMAAQGKLARI